MSYDPIFPDMQEIKPEMIRPGAAFGNPIWQSWAELNGKLGGWLANTTVCLKYDARYSLGV